MAETEAALILLDLAAASILMELDQQSPASPALLRDGEVLDLRSSQEKQKVTVSGPVTYFGTGQVIGTSTYTKTIPIHQMKNHFFANEVYRARLETVSSTYELQCFLALYTDGLEQLYGKIEKGLKDSRTTRKALRKPLPNLPVDEMTPKKIRMRSMCWNKGREPVQWEGQFKYLSKKGEKELEKVGRKSRETWATIVGVRNLIGDCEARIWEADKDCVIGKRSERPLPRKQRRWKEGRPGWTGLTPDDIRPRKVKEFRHRHRILLPGGRRVPRGHGEFREGYRGIERGHGRFR